MENNIQLQQLSLTNFATFKSGTTQFKNGLNSIVGETGSGKSLLLDALQFILGQRADKKIIRKDSEFASLEAIFSVHSDDVKNYFMEIGFPFEDNQIVIKRIIQSSGKSKVFLNHQISTIKTIQDFSLKFIDFVGQFSNQKLLNDKYQLDIIDSYASLGKLKKQYQDIFNELSQSKNDLRKYQEQETQRLRKIDYLQFQIKEIEELDPSLEEEKKLIEQKEFLQNFEKKLKLNQDITELIEGERGVLDITRLIKGKTLEAPSLFPEDKLAFIEEALELFQDFSSELSGEMNQELDEEELTDLVDKLDSYQKMKRKLGPEISDVLNNLSAFNKELEELQGVQTQLEGLEVNINSLEKKAVKLAKELSVLRKEASHKFSEQLVKRLKKLNMPKVKIELRLKTSTQLTLHGLDQLLFYIETNPGEGLFLLQDVASGGELSRILLSIREIHAKHNSNISIFLFDEIDTGIGGQTAIAMGEVLKEISKDSQVIAITHLPQIAQFSNYLIEVSKKTQNKRTESLIKEYNAHEVTDFAKEMSLL